jgi:putative NIF3 family GTP cyclohydrolase 1 type 2
MGATGPDITAETIVAYVQELAGHPLRGDEGMHHGDTARPVRRVLICWMATADALRYAGEQSYDLVLAHESLYYPYDAVVRTDNPPGWQEWPTNRQRRELLERHDMGLLRVHGSLDEICIYDDFVALLGLGEPVECHGLARVYQIEPCPLAALVARVKKATGMAALRVSAPGGMAQIVHRVGLPWGGLGLFVNVGYQQQLVELGCDVFIAGESDSYGFRFAAECGIPMIETGHEISENPGLERFSHMLAERFPTLHVAYYDCPSIWHIT